MVKVEIGKAVDAKKGDIILREDCGCEVDAWINEGKMTIQHGRAEALFNISGKELIGCLLKEDVEEIQIRYDKWVKEVHDYWDECGKGIN